MADAHGITSAKVSSIPWYRDSARSDIRKYPRYHRPIALLPHFRFNREEEGKGEQEER